jgi:hypothetical protein
VGYTRYTRSLYNSQKKPLKKKHNRPYKRGALRLTDSPARLPYGRHYMSFSALCQEKSLLPLFFLLLPKIHPCKVDKTGQEKTIVYSRAASGHHVCVTSDNLSDAGAWGDSVRYQVWPVEISEGQDRQVVESDGGEVQEEKGEEVMESRTECQECGHPCDFGKEMSGSCSTCGKKWLCYSCCYSHECLPGKGRHLCIITNPAWIMNLIKTRGEDERGERV